MKVVWLRISFRFSGMAAGKSFFFFFYNLKIINLCLTSSVGTRVILISVLGVENYKILRRNSNFQKLKSKIEPVLNSKIDKYGLTIITPIQS
jgi:hypothetical protein